VSIINKLLDIFKNFAVLCQGSKQLLVEVKPMSSDVFLKTGKTRADFREKQLEKPDLH
tara:strand:+ start:3077 stop:3250 length:174 start_codon:yes stop_codon:yes gene_type:complete